MKLTGNKLLATAVFSLTGQMALANEVTAPSLTTFEAGTPAKAAEVNGNFDGLKAYGEGLHGIINAQAALIASLEEKVAVLESASSDEYNIAVHGDGQLIGYAKQIPSQLYSTRLVVKTALGFVTVQTNSDSFTLRSYNIEKPDAELPSINYADASCTQPFIQLSYSDGRAFVITKTANVFSSPYMFLDSDYPDSYVLEAGTNITTANTAYKKNWEGVCSLDEYFDEGSTIAPLAVLNPEVHGIKSSYDVITVEGYVVN